jgi:hypothetical protein
MEWLVVSLLIFVAIVSVRFQVLMAASMKMGYSDVSEVRTASIISTINKPSAKNRVEISGSVGQRRILAGPLGKGVTLMRRVGR